MLLPDDLLAGIEAEGPSHLPPFPPRRTGPVGIPELVRLYRRNIIGVFSARDYERPLIRTNMLRLPVVTVNSPELVQEAFQTKHETFQRKTPQMRHALSPLLGDGLFVSDGPVWRARRAAVTPILHAGRMRDFGPAITETIAEWRDHWAALPKDADGAARIDALSEMAELTAEVISRAAFGRRLGRDFTGPLVRGFSAYQAHVDQVDLPSVLGLPDGFPRFQGLRARRALRQVHRVIDDVVARILRGERDETAVITRLLDFRDEAGRPLTPQAIRNEAIVIFMAGHETTANTLAWAWHLLAHAPRVRAKLHAELDAALAGRAPGIDDLRDLPYTRAVIEETLRLYPPVPILGRQAMTDETLGGKPVAKGSVVMAVPFMLHRRPALWSMPDHFVPERFDPRIAPRPGKYAYIPFAIGPRICPGLTFGLAEAMLALATLAQSFDLAPEPGHAVEAVCRLTLRPGDRLPMRLRARA